MQEGMGIKRKEIISPCPPSGDSVQKRLLCGKAMRQPVQEILFGPVAQSVEHLTFNQRVPGSSPGRLTKTKGLAAMQALLLYSFTLHTLDTLKYDAA